MVFLFGRLKAGLLFLLSLVKRSLCCLRRRRKLSADDDDSAQLTHIGVIPSQGGSHQQYSNYTETGGGGGCWSDWNEEPRQQQPNTVEQYIQEYRSKAKESPPAESPPDYFQDMEPRIKRQTKVLLKPSSSVGSPAAVSSRLAFNLESPLVVGPRDSGELETWEEREGGERRPGGGQWEEGWEATEEILRETRREEQRRRLQEQREQRKTLVAKLS